MTYDPTIPIPDEDLLDGQANLLNNFTTLNTRFSVNHVALNSTANNGKHNMVLLKYDNTIPIEATSSLDMVMAPHTTASNRIYPVVNYQSNAEESVGFIPFASMYGQLAASPTVTTIGTALNLSATWGGSTITFSFTANADNANYFVRTSYGNSVAAVVGFTMPYVTSQTTSGFSLVTGGTFTAGEQFYIFVYEVP